MSKTGVKLDRIDQIKNVQYAPVKINDIMVVILKYLNKYKVKKEKVKQIWHQSW